MSKLILPMPPSVNHYKKYYCTGHVNEYGHHIVRSSVSPKALEYREMVGWEAKACGVRLSYEKMAVQVDVFCLDNKLKLDLDNIPKVLLDSLTGIAWEDDRQVYDIHVRRYLVKKNPHIEVSISPYVEADHTQLEVSLSR